MSIDLLRGPDVVVAGAARSGTTYFAARLGRHPRIDPGTVKEPNYFSRRLDDGPTWYESLYRPEPGLLRLDASVSYAYPQHAGALPLVAETSPDALCVYIVRDPIDRAISHYHYNRHYFGHETASTFAEALGRDRWYLDVGDYEHWLATIDGCFDASRVLVVPFRVVRAEPGAATDAACAALGIDALDIELAADDLHRNQVVEHRSDTVRRAVRRIRHSRAYPAVRKALGADLTRAIRSRLVREPERPAVDDELRRCGAALRADLGDFARRVDAAVTDRLRRQDEARGLSWATAWQSGDRVA
jgi:Sulfotransferase family